MNQSISQQDRSRLLRRLAAEDFAVYEAILYLDGHPKNRKALQYYKNHLARADMLRAEYTEKYGPLTPFSGTESASWEWINGPWPWEKEGN